MKLSNNKKNLNRCTIKLAENYYPVIACRGEERIGKAFRFKVEIQHALKHIDKLLGHSTTINFNNRIVAGMIDKVNYQPTSNNLVVYFTSCLKKLSLYSSGIQIYPPASLQEHVTKLGVRRGLPPSLWLWSSNDNPIWPYFIKPKGDEYHHLQVVLNIHKLIPIFITQHDFEQVEIISDLHQRQCDDIKQLKELVHLKLRGEHGGNQISFQSTNEYLMPGDRVLISFEGVLSKITTEHYIIEEVEHYYTHSGAIANGSGYYNYAKARSAATLIQSYPYQMLELPTYFTAKIAENNNPISDERAVTLPESEGVIRLPYLLPNSGRHSQFNGKLYPGQTVVLGRLGGKPPSIVILGALFSEGKNPVHRDALHYKFTTQSGVTFMIDDFTHDKQLGFYTSPMCKLWMKESSVSELELFSKKGSLQWRAAKTIHWQTEGNCNVVTEGSVIANAGNGLHIKSQQVQIRINEHSIFKSNQAIEIHAQATCYLRAKKYIDLYSSAAISFKANDITCCSQQSIAFHAKNDIRLRAKALDLTTQQGSLSVKEGAWQASVNSVHIIASEHLTLQGRVHYGE